MHILSNLKNYIYDENGFIAIYNNHVYLYNIEKINIINNDYINIEYSNKKVIIKGNNFIVNKCQDKELLINGNVESIRMS